MNKYLKLAIFCIVSYMVVIFSLILLNKFIKPENKKDARKRDIIFFSVAVLTVLLHYSYIFYCLIKNIKVEILDIYYLPVYPCNLFMWQNLVIGIMIIINKYNNKFFQIIAIPQFLVGILAGSIGLIFNINFLNTPSFLDFEILKSLLSHVTLIFCCLYLLVGKYIKIIGIKNMAAIIFESLIMVFCGVYSNLVIKLQGKESVNAYFLENPPIEKYPFINIITMGILAYALYFLIFFIYEKIKKPKDGILYYLENL